MIRVIADAVGRDLGCGVAIPADGINPPMPGTFDMGRRYRRGRHRSDPIRL
jgi:hypothetical protein